MTELISKTLISPEVRQVLNTAFSGEATFNVITAATFSSSAITLADSAIITWDYSLGKNATVTLSDNRVLNITNCKDGAQGTLTVKQDGTGGRTLTFGSGMNKVANGGNGSITLSIAPNSVDELSFLCTASYLNPVYTPGELTYCWNIQNNFSGLLSTELKITFDDILNSPVLPATDFAGWNTFFDTNVNADMPFSGASVTGNTVALSGPTCLKFKDSLFYSNTNIISVNDDPYTAHIGVDTFSGCTSLSAASMQIASTIKNGTGGRTLTFGSGMNKVANGGNGSITLSIAPNSVDELSFLCTASYLNPVYTPGELTYCWNIQNNFSGLLSTELKITFDDILNSPVLPATDFAGWNTFFDTNVNADMPFSGASVTGNTVALSGPTCLKFKDSLFYSNTNIISVNDDPYTAHIGVDTFSGCTSLSAASMQIASTIKIRAFHGCISLSNINIPSAVTIGDGAFFNCTSLSNISLPVVRIIGENSFSNCTLLSNLLLPLTTTIGTYAFINCTSLKDVSLPLATSIGTDAFLDCTSLTGMTIGLLSIMSGSIPTTIIDLSCPSAIDINHSAFYNCTNLKDVLFPIVTGVSKSAFANCTSLSNIYFPAVNKIGEIIISGPSFEGAFYNCISLSGVSIPTVTIIGNDSFNSCTGLTTVSLPSATILGKSAFINCISLTNIMLSSTTTMGVDVFDGITKNEITLTIPQTLLESSNSSIMTLTGENTVTIIAV